LIATRQASWCGSWTIKNWRFHFQERNIVIEAKNVEIFVGNNALDSLNFCVITRNIVTADECLLIDFIFILIENKIIASQTRISCGSKLETQCAAVNKYLFVTIVAPQ
jgi:hypothetical protein